MATQSQFLAGVRDYYDKNTPRFVRSHQSAVARAIHREVWGPGVASEKDAFEYLNELVLQSLPDPVAAPVRILDLGCGVGGTLMHLARRTALDGVGVSLSPVGVAIARDLARKSGLADRCRFLEANYLDLPDVGERDAAYAIESFLHGPDAAAFFRSAASVLRPGGRLIVCDDFLAPSVPDTAASRRYLSDFRRGWHVGTLVPVSEAESHARRAGFRLLQDQDLTRYLRLQRPCDRKIAAFVNLGRWLPFRSAWWDSWVGGHAIQRCLLTGVIEYHFLVFEK
jgi:SAM-dependent methyltransferase